MAFSVQDFQDLVRLLEERPDWRAELRRLVLTDELLGLPDLVRELAEAQRRTEGELGELRATVGELAAAQRRTEGALGELAAAQREIAGHVGEMRGDFLERRYRDRAGAYFGRLLRRARLVSADELDALLDEGLAAATLDDDAAHDVRLADLIVRGRRPDEDRDTYLVVEVSAGVGLSDVERAVRRAGLLGRVRPALPTVAGDWVTPEAEAMAKSYGVWRVLDGRAVAPSARG